MAGRYPEIRSAEAEAVRGHLTGERGMGELKRAVATAVPPVKSAVITVPADPAEREVREMR